jgi:hypothetical protein
MGICVYCHKPAGFLRTAHKECKKQHQSGEQRILSLVAGMTAKSVSEKQLEAIIKNEAKNSFIDEKTQKKLIIAGWEQAVERAFDDGLLSQEEEDALVELQTHFNLTQDSLDTHGAYSKVVKGAVLRDILSGKIPERVKIAGALPFNLQKNEILVWVFQNVDYYEEKTCTHYKGGSHGVSIRVAKGIYYRVGAFKGRRVQTQEAIHDTGLLGVTNKQIYFAGSTKRFRIGYNKIVAIEPYSNGISILRDAATAKPQTFVTGEGWFIYNLMTNLAQI